MKFGQLIEAINQAHVSLQASAAKAVNRHLTFRNWLIGYYIVEFEQNGEDRAAYGSRLREKIAEKIAIKGLSAPELSRCRQFYQAYQPILGLMTQEFGNLLPKNIVGLPSQESKPSLSEEEQAHLKAVILNIAYSHLTELIKIDDTLKRRYYELLVLKTHPTVKELKRQISSLSFERLGLSADKEVAFKQVQQKIEPATTMDLIKSHHFFDFLNLPSSQLVSEGQLEQALLEHLQEFIIELGHGFCFQARQQKILIGDEYFFIDLVFYHRILKCHVLIDLKVEEFSHTNAGQLNTYLNYYKAEVMQANDNPPVGILLVTNKNDALVQYATAGMDQQLFVKKYQLALPTKEQLETFIKQELKNAVQ
jgi:predicted nuclease of restriction endonuclease-like (RecB) superfamily